MTDDQVKILLEKTKVKMDRDWQQAVRAVLAMQDAHPDLADWLCQKMRELYNESDDKKIREFVDESPAELQLFLCLAGTLTIAHATFLHLSSGSKCTCNPTTSNKR